MRTKIFKTVLSVLVIGFFVVLAFGSGEDSGGSGSSSSPSSSEMQYCKKHDRWYNPNNAYGGCPDCVKEKDQKSMEKALEKSRRL